MARVGVATDGTVVPGGVAPDPHSWLQTSLKIRGMRAVGDAVPALVATIAHALEGELPATAAATAAAAPAAPATAPAMPAAAATVVKGRQNATGLRTSHYRTASTRGRAANNCTTSVYHT